MRRFLLACSLALPLFVGGAQAQPTVVGPGNAILCNKIATFTGTAALASVIPAVTGQVINICGWQATNTAAAGTFNLSFGTGTNCATTNTSITGALSVGATAVSAQSAFSTFSTPVSNLVCQNSTATVTGVIWYSQFGIPGISP